MAEAAFQVLIVVVLQNWIARSGSENDIDSICRFRDGASMGLIMPGLTNDGFLFCLVFVKFESRLPNGTGSTFVKRSKLIMKTWLDELPFGELSWSFYGEPYDSREKLYDALAQLPGDPEEFETLAKWNPFKIVVDNPSLWIAYVARDGSGNYVWTQLQADNGKNFPAIELLQKSHNYFVGDPIPTNHNFLEGIELVDEHDDGSPMYCLYCGS